MAAIQKMMLTMVAIALATTARADCGHFFRHHKQQQVVVQQVVAQQYYPPVYYAAGLDLQAEALAEKVARLVQQKLVQQQSAAPIMQKVQVPTAFAKCTSCHSGPSAAGGLVLDGSTAIDCHAYFRWGQIAGQNRDVPAKMAGIVARMTPEEKGAINDAMLNLVTPRANPSGNPPPPPDPGGLE